MSNKAIIKNPKKKNKHVFQSILGYARTLFSNQACIDRGTGKSTITNELVGVKKTWYISVIFFIIAILAAVTPLAVHANKINGSDFLNGQKFGYDDAIVSAVLEDENFVSYEEEGNLTLDDLKFDNKSKLQAPGSNPNGFTYLGYHTKLHTNSSESQTTSKVKDFDIYYVRSLTSSIPDSTKNAYEYISEKTYEYDGTKIKETTLEDGSTTPSVIDRNCGFIIFTETTFVAMKMSYGDTSSANSVNGDYEHMGIKEGMSISSLLTKNIENPTHDDIIKNFKTFLDKGYKNNKTKSIWVQSGISLGVNGGLTLILGLVVFLMTRGKNNPNRVIKWYQCFLIVFYASLCPGILSLALGFMFSGLEIMLYVITFGVRIMWMSMRSLKPQV